MNRDDTFRAPGPTRKLAILALSLIATCPAFAAPDPVFDIAAITAVPLNPKVLTSSERDGLVTEEVMFHSEDDGPKSVDIFGIFVYPKGAVKAPAFIWNQGGLAKASANFPELGAKRGYATLCIDFPMPGYRSTGAYPIVSGLEVGDDPRQAPIYHGAVALLQAVTYLQSRPEVDPERIGMAGSSWGGFYTTLMAGVDARLKAASAMFGTGSLQLGNAWWDGTGVSKKDEAARERWRTTLDPAWRLATSHVPIAWFTGTNDQFYWMPAVSKTYEMATAPKLLALFPNWNHALPEVGDEQVFAWLDAQLKGGAPFLEVGPLKLETGIFHTTARWSYRGAAEIKAAHLYVSFGEEGNWKHRYWIPMFAHITRGGQGECSIDVPSNLPCSIIGTVIDTRGFRSSTPLLRVGKGDFGPKAVRQFLPYDGAGSWGGFEASQVEYATRAGLRLPPVTTGGRTGPGAVQLAPGTSTELPPFLYTAGLPHVLRLFLKSSVSAQVSISVANSLDPKVPPEQSEHAVGTDWTPVEIAITPEPTGKAEMSVALTVPKAATMLLDDVSLTPDWPAFIQARKRAPAVPER